MLVAEPWDETIWRYLEKPSAKSVILNDLRPPGVTVREYQFRLGVTARFAGNQATMGMYTEFPDMDRQSVRVVAVLECVMLIVCLVLYGFSALLLALLLVLRGLKWLLPNFPDPSIRTCVVVE